MDFRVAVTTLILNLMLLVPAAQSDTFNCPEPDGELTFDQTSYYNAWPSHTDRLFPQPFDIDYSCRIDGEGKFVDCSFAPRQEMSESQERTLEAVLPRVMQAITAQTSDQSCVAAKISFRFGDPPSKPAPYEPAG